MSGNIMFEPIKRVAAFAVLTASVVAPTYASAEGRLDATLEAPYSFDAQRSAVVRLTLRNNGDEAVTVYKWDTPFAPAGGRLPRSQFFVTDSAGAEVRYRGRWVNMGPILADQFYTICPGEELSKEVDLIHEYDYGNGGAFAVSYSLDVDREPDVGLVSATDRSAFVRNAQVHIDSNPVLIQVNGPVPRVAAAIGDASQVASIDAAKNRAFDYVWNANIFMDERYDRVRGDDGTYKYVFVPQPRYERLFGSHNPLEPMPDEPGWGDGDSAQVYKAVGALFECIVGGPGVRLNPMCGCPGYPLETSAWSEYDTTFVAHFCKKFFSLPEFDTYASRIGTIVHEFSHFNAYYPGRSDYAYGRDVVEKLTKSDRSTAVRNADNFEYFVNDTTPYEVDRDDAGRVEAMPFRTDRRLTAR
jgi:lysine-specific metallo-endopeptidase family protein